MARACIGIGSNLGGKETNCRKALEFLERKGIEVVSRSAAYITRPWGKTGQPDFVNMAACLETGLPARELLNVLLETEKEMGRVREEKWGPRVIDLDLLLYGDEVISEPDLNVPHPLMHEREFVLRPLAEIAPDAVHPVLKKSVRQLLRELEEKGPA